jgi:MFS family permease
MPAAAAPLPPDLRLFSRPAYAAAGATAAFTGAAMFGAALLFPLYLQIGRHQSVLASGLLLISLSAGTALVLPVSGRLVDRHGGGIVSMYGGVAAVVTTVPFALLDTHTNHVVVQLLLLVRGMAIALAVMPATTAAYTAVTTAELPDATTQVNILLRIGGVIFAVVLASALPDGIDGAFRTAFWWLTAASALGLATAAWPPRPGSPPPNARRERMDDVGGIARPTHASSRLGRRKHQPKVRSRRNDGAGSARKSPAPLTPARPSEPEDPTTSTADRAAPPS